MPHEKTESTGRARRDYHWTSGRKKPSRSKRSSSSSSSSKDKKKHERKHEKKHDRKDQTPPRPPRVGKQRPAITQLEQVGNVLRQIIDNSRFQEVWFFIATTEGFFNGTLRKLLPNSRHPSILTIETMTKDFVHINLEKLISMNIVDKDIHFVDSKGKLMFDLLLPPSSERLKTPPDTKELFESGIRAILSEHARKKDKIRLYLVPSAAPDGLLDAVGYGVTFIDKNCFVVSSYISAVGPCVEEAQAQVQNA